LKQPQAGLTLVEILIAVVILGAGILALTGSSGLITRMIGRGKVETQAALRASRRVEMLRQIARGSSPPCTATAFASGGPILSDGFVESWEVAPTGSSRRVRVTITYLTVRGRRSAVLETRLAC
jgi:prepilin-type N-terminal cleavage/methylation domain-containing protein